MKPHYTRNNFKRILPGKPMNHKFNNKPKYMRTININVSKQQVAEIVAKTEWAQPKTNPPT